MKEARDDGPVISSSSIPIEHNTLLISFPRKGIRGKQNCICEFETHAAIKEQLYRKQQKNCSPVAAYDRIGQQCLSIIKRQLSRSSLSRFYSRVVIHACFSLSYQAVALPGLE
ncbi:hypothetical protein Baya_3081 [Bagarius yarrelli]|uniref:Uncharacterized protein n=1 Tax=Bagarius yarrelli TaxID=175774 RepID=A0A556TUD3_BAGYA|nr:hypothetical protein Baya_3081 [Bagarius yarrelli]